MHLFWHQVISQCAVIDNPATFCCGVIEVVLKQLNCRLKPTYCGTRLIIIQDIVCPVNSFLYAFELSPKHYAVSEGYAKSVKYAAGYYNQVETV